jgi:hypothetical protein
MSPASIAKHCESDTCVKGYEPTLFFRKETMEQERNQRSKEFTGANNAHEERMCPTEREIRDDSMIVHGGHLKLCCRPRIMCINPMSRIPGTQKHEPLHKHEQINGKNVRDYFHKTWDEEAPRILSRVSAIEKSILHTKWRKNCCLPGTVFFSSGCGDWVPAIILFLFF